MDSFVVYKVIVCVFVDVVWLFVVKDVVVFFGWCESFSSCDCCGVDMVDVVDVDGGELVE